MKAADCEFNDNAIVTAHFNCECGHRWQRDLYDGLIVVACPVCEREHLTDLGKIVARLMKRSGTTFGSS